MSFKTHVASDETLQRIARALEVQTMMGGLVYDSADGCYTNQSIANMLAKRFSGLAYGVSIPKGSATTCTKIGANAGIADPIPGVIGRPAVDPYSQLGPFFHMDVNAYVDPDGTPHVTAVDGDGRFARDGSNGSVWVLAPVLYWLYDDTDESAATLSISDTELQGMAPQPQAYLPSGGLRPYMLYAKYAGSNDGNGNMVSVSGAKPWNRTISHDTLITACDNATTGYSGKSIADDWYVKVMFTVKYATKNSQSVMAGCTSYDVQVAPTVAETGVTRIIVSNANAAKLLVGSAMMFGTHTGNNDRNTASNYNIFDGVRISSIETYDENNMAVYMDTATTFDTETTYLFSTSPWWSGACDQVIGDGSPTSNSSGKEPCSIQGIELFVGLLEVLGDVIVSSNGTDGWIPFVCYDSRNEATSVTANYTSTGKALPSNSADGHKYALYPENGGGLLFGTTTGGSQTVGLCDTHYTNKITTTGTREWRGLGLLHNGGSAGVWFVYADYALTAAHWSIGSRPSATGRALAA